MGPARKKAAPRPRRTAPQSARPRQRRPQNSQIATHEIWHPAMSQHVWVPRSLKDTALVRVRDYSQFQITAGGVNATAVLLSGCTSTTAPTFYMGQLGAYGAGGTVGIAGTAILSVNSVAGAFASGRARLHRMGVTISCLGPTTAGVLLPNTYVRYGAIRGVINPGSFALWQDIVAHIQAKADLHTKTGYELMQRSGHCCAPPVDRLEWQQLKSCINSFNSNYNADDGLATIAIYISTGTSADLYNITIHADWDYLPADEGQTLVSSTATTHPSLPESVVDAAANAANTVAGVFEGGERVVAGVARAGAAITRAVSHLPAAYPSLTGRVWGPRMAALAAA